MPRFYMQNPVSSVPSGDGLYCKCVSATVPPKRIVDIFSQRQGMRLPPIVPLLAFRFSIHWHAARGVPCTSEKSAGIGELVTTGGCILCKVGTNGRGTVHKKWLYE